MDPYTLELEQPVAEVLACALLRTIDDLEARAVIAEHHDPGRGPTSAAGYRTDIRRLQTLLTQVAPDGCRRDADPEQAAIHWIDGLYTVAHGHPVRLVPQPRLQALLESTLAMVDHGLLDPHDALTALHHLADQDATTHTGPTTTFDDDLDVALPVATSTDARIPSLPAPQAAHRLAPGCRPAPDLGREPGAGPC